MNKLHIAFTAILTLMVSQNQALAGSSEVTWTNPDDYRDVQPSNETRKHFRERIFKSFEKHFAKLAKRLPEQQTLKLDVTDVDLAGDTLAGGIERLRIVKEIYSPRMKFSYQLVDKNDNIIKSADVALKDMSFMTGNNLKYRQKSLGYEKKMLDDWFFETFSDNLTTK